VLLIWLVGSTRDPGHPADDPSASTGTSSHQAGSVDHGGPVARDVQRPLDAGPAQPPVIDEIVVEKPSVCEGEENLITVRAHDPAGNDGGLRCLINGQAGFAVPVRAWNNDEDPNAPPRSVQVLADNGGFVTVPIPDYQIHECTPAARLRLSSSLMPNSTGEYRFQTKIIMSVPPGTEQPKSYAMADFHATRFQWDFGDGEKQTTDSGYVIHSYEFRRQDSHFSYYVVSVVASDDKGRSLAARYSLEIMNPAYEELHVKGIVKIMSHMTPRFPEIGSDGKVRQVVRLWHFRSEPITVTRLTAYYYSRSSEELGSSPVPAGELLGTDRLPPGQGISVQVVLDTEDNAELGFITYDVQGTTADGQHAMGTFSIMRPPDPPTRDRNIPVKDPMLAAKILEARRILGKEFVTDEEIWALERQGRFEGLQPVDLAPTDDGPPKWLPRPPHSGDDPGPEPEQSPDR